LKIHQFRILDPIWMNDIEIEKPSEQGEQTPNEKRTSAVCTLITIVFADLLTFSATFAQNRLKQLWVRAICCVHSLLCHSNLERLTF
jgi:hypothetical protein